MQPFTYLRPETLAEAIGMLEEHGSDARILAGGTDLTVGLRKGSIRPAVVVDLKRVEELRPDICEVDGSLRVTATTVMTQVVDDERIRRHFPALVEAADIVGSVQIRNRATLVGNMCNASPAADTAPPMLVYGATLNIAGPGGSRTVPLDEFFEGPGRTVLERGELVTSIDLPIPTEPVGSAFARLTRRKGTDLATINLCCRVDADGAVAFAFGAVGPRPFKVEDRSGVLADPDADPERGEQILEELVSHATPITDLRGSEEYRRATLLALSRRALRRAIARLNDDAEAEEAA